MLTALKRILPNGFELIGLGFLTIFVTILGNSQQLIEYYGLSSSTDVIKTSASQAISNGLAVLDSFSFTRTVITFIIWGVVGLLSLSVVQAIGRVWQTIEYDEEVSSKHYVHPRMFTRKRFWREVIEDFFGLAAGVILLATSLYCFMAVVWPVGLTYARDFLLSMSLAKAGLFVVGLFVLYCGLTVILSCLKLLLHRHHLFDRAEG